MRSASPARSSSRRPTTRRRPASSTSWRGARRARRRRLPAGAGARRPDGAPRPRGRAAAGGGGCARAPGARLRRRLHHAGPGRKGAGRGGAAVIYRAVEAIRAGLPVILPTDTVYGFCTTASFAEAVERLYRLKGRPGTRPTAIVAADL